jgi:hypothetical protein
VPERFLDGSFGPEDTRVMNIAFDKACDALGLAKTHDGVTESLARMIVQQADTGERDPDKLCALTLAALRTVIAGRR